MLLWLVDHSRSSCHLTAQIVVFPKISSLLSCFHNSQGLLWLLQTSLLALESDEQMDVISSLEIPASQSWCPSIRTIAYFVHSYACTASQYIVNDALIMSKIP